LENLSPLNELYLNTNLLSQNIPNTIGKLLQLQFLYVYENNLKGTIPVEFSFLVNLTSFYIHSNQLSGSLPSFLFQPSLKAIVAASNCFTGSIPESICQSEGLIEVVLDGLHGSSYCTKKLFPIDPQSSSILSSDVLYGNIPSCLFGLQYLTILHLSGNNLAGSLPSDLNLSSSLQSVILSNNRLKGSIPRSFTDHGFYYLDLSFNRFNGDLLSRKQSEIVFS
jgi:Leucine-rich repeat (LRR) protein